MWLARLELRDLRNLEAVDIELGDGLNVLYGRNAQGKTSVLEGVGLLARARSFRSEDTRAAVRRGTPGLLARGEVRDGERPTTLAVSLGTDHRRLSVDGAEVPPGRYHGRFEVAVYSTERLRVVRGTQRDRRSFVDRSAGALWPAYRRVSRQFERVLRQRNAALEHGARDLEAWTERLIEAGAALRQRRSDYVRRLDSQLASGFRIAAESYSVAVEPELGPEAEVAHRGLLGEELGARASAERHARRTLVGPHRDSLAFRIGSEDPSTASSGQARSLLLALTLASLDVYREETGRSAVALLDDLDSELDESRVAALCSSVARRGQALVTTAHQGWVTSLGHPLRAFHVRAGRVEAA
jgi:DNA replication and repair protein RecF